MLAEVAESVKRMEDLRDGVTEGKVLLCVDGG